MADNSTDSGIDPFVLGRVFADPQALLNHQCVDLDESKDEAIVCLDANVLLLPYEFSGTSLDSLIGVYEKLAKDSRLKIPARAAQEYLKHRAEKIAEIDKTFADHSSVSRNCLGQVNFMEGNKSLQELRGFESDIKAIEKKVRGRIEKLRQELNGEAGSDPISKAYRPVFEGAVVELAGFDEKDFLKDLEYRYSNQIPPGFKDAGKPDHGVGDLMIWKTILQIGRDTKRHLIFVTADSKGDWWTKRGNSERARLELVEEYRSASDGGSLYLMKLSDLLKLYGVNSSEVESVKHVEEGLERSISLRLRAAEQDESEWREARADMRRLQSLIEELKFKRKSVREKIAQMRADNDEYSPSFLFKELERIDQEMAHCSNAYREALRYRNELAHGGGREALSWRVDSQETAHLRRCMTCGSRSVSLRSDGRVFCLDCSAIG